MNINEFRITYALPTYLCKVKRRNNIDQSYVYVDNFWEKCCCLILILVKKAEKRKANDEPTDPETPRNKDLKYDREKRTIIFQNSWIDKFPWVVFDENAQEMYCKYRRKFPHLSDRKDALTQGTKNLCIDGLKLHDKHQEHLLCVKHWFKELGDPQAALFNTAYGVVKAGKPFSDYELKYKLKMDLTWVKTIEILMVVKLLLTSK